MDPVYQKILTYGQAQEKAEALRQENKRIIMISGCFDLLHRGHLQILSSAKSQGDVLFVSLGSDKTVKTLKGEERPIMNQRYRAELLAAILFVDYVVIAEEEMELPSGIDFNQLIKVIRPHAFAIHAGNRSVEEKREVVEQAGGELIVIQEEPLTHTTIILKRLEQL